MSIFEVDEHLRSEEQSADRHRANRFGALGKAHFQDTIVEARFDLVLIHGVGNP